MLEKYKEYIDSFDDLDKEDKQQAIIENIEELIKFLYKANKNFIDAPNILPVFKNPQNDDEFLKSILTYILSLKELSAETVDILIEEIK